jgi:hypothetical protein
MPAITENKSPVSLNGVLAAAKKLSTEEKQLLRMKLFANDAIKEMKAFEAAMKKKRKPIKRKDAEIVSIVKATRIKNGTL